MSSYVTLQFTCPHCDKTHSFTLLPEGEAVKESGEKPARETRTAAEFAENIQEMKAGKKGHAPELSKKRRSRLLSRRLKGRPVSSRKPETSALLDRKLAGKGLAQ